MSVPPLKALVYELLQGMADVESVIQPGESPHNWQPTASRMKALVKADLFILVGLGYEEKLLLRLPEIDSTKRLFLWQGQELLEGHHDHDESHDTHDTAEKEASFDPHLWTSPRRMIEALSVLEKKMLELLPQQSSEIKSRIQIQRQKFAQLDQEVSRIFAPIKGKPLFFYHPAFNYLLTDYGLSSLELEKEGKIPGTQSLLILLENVKSQGIRVLWIQPQYSLRKLNPILTDFGLQTKIADPMDKDFFEKVLSLANEWAQEIRERGD